MKMLPRNQWNSSSSKRLGCMSKRDFELNSRMAHRAGIYLQEGFWRFGVLDIVPYMIPVRSKNIVR